MRGQPGHNTRPHTRLPPSFLGMDAWTTSQPNVALISKLRRSLMCLASFWNAIHGYLYNQVLAIVRSIGAGIKCLYCMCCNPSRLNKAYRILYTSVVTFLCHQGSCQRADLFPKVHSSRSAPPPRCSRSSFGCLATPPRPSFRRT